MSIVKKSPDRNRSDRRPFGADERQTSILEYFVEKWSLCWVEAAQLTTLRRESGDRDLISRLGLQFQIHRPMIEKTVNRYLLSGVGNEAIARVDRVYFDI
jgi:hypothetical protein